MKYLLTFAVILAFIMLPLVIYAQPGLPDSPSQTPIDGGLIWMLIAGGAYGIKKIRADHIEK